MAVSGSQYDTRPTANGLRVVQWIAASMLFLDIGMMIVSIMAYTGAQMEEDRDIIKDTYITFPSAGHHIQRLEIALPSAGIVMQMVVVVLIMARMSRFNAKIAYETGRRVKMAILCVILPWVAGSLAAWAVCIAFQASYVPIITPYNLPECAEYGDELSQCDMVSASWIMAMIYCVLCTIQLGYLLFAYYHLRYPGAHEGTFVYRKASTPRKPPPPPSYRSRPPSYHSNMSRPPSYHEDVPKKQRNYLFTHMATLRE